MFHKTLFLFLNIAQEDVNKASMGIDTHMDMSEADFIVEQGEIDMDKITFFHRMTTPFPKILHNKTEYDIININLDNGDEFEICDIYDNFSKAINDHRKKKNFLILN